MSEDWGVRLRASNESYRMAQRKRAEAERDLHLAQAQELNAWLENDALQAEFHAEQFDAQELAAIGDLPPPPPLYNEADIDQWDNEQVRELFKGNREAYDHWRATRFGKLS